MLLLKNLKGLQICQRFQKGKIRFKGGWVRHCTPPENALEKFSFNTFMTGAAAFAPIADIAAAAPGPNIFLRLLPNSRF